MYITPILGIALNEKEQENLKMDIRVGYALNKHTILMIPHYKYNLNPVYYWVIPSIRTVQCVTQFDVYFEFSFYLSVKINDNRFMSEEKKQDLLDIFNNNYIVDDIAKIYFQVNKLNFDFKMVKNPIDYKYKYPVFTKEIKKIFEDGFLDIGICNHMYKSYNSIISMTEESFNYVYPDGKTSYLKQIFPDYYFVKDIKEQIIKHILSTL